MINSNAETMVHEIIRHEELGTTAFFAIGSMNSSVNWLVGMPAHLPVQNWKAIGEVWFLSENKIREWTALSMPTLSMHNYCLSTKCWYATAGNRYPPSPISSSDPYQSMLTETVDRFTYPSDGQCCTASIRPPALVSQRITRIEPRTTTKKNNMTRKN